MATHQTDEAPPTRGGLDDDARQELESLAGKMRQWAKAAFLSSEAQVAPKGSFERRFIEHGGTCYYNCWSALREFLDASSSQSSATQEEL